MVTQQITTEVGQKPKPSHSHWSVFFSILSYSPYFKVEDSNFEEGND